MAKEFRKAQKTGVNPIKVMAQEIDEAIDELKFNINLFRARLNVSITKEQMERQLDERHSQNMSFMADDGDFAQLLQQAAEQLFHEMEAEIRRGGRSSHAKVKR
jgi:hypothetical protein